MCYTEWKQQLKTVELQAFPPPPPSSPHQSVCHEVTSAHSCSWPRVGPWVGSNVEESLSLPACGFLLSQVQPWWNLPVGQTTSSPVLVQPRHCRICFFSNHHCFLSCIYTVLSFHPLSPLHSPHPGLSLSIPFCVSYSQAGQAVPPFPLFTQRCF